MIFEQIYTNSKTIDKHCQASLCREREEYLSYLLQEGFSRNSLISAAAYMLHIVRVLSLEELRVITEDEIRNGAASWAEYRGPFRDQRHNHHGSPRSFVKVAHSWLRFHEKLALSPDPPFTHEIQLFSYSLRFIQGLTEATVRSYSNRVHLFLKWLAAQSGSLELITVNQIDQFLSAKRAEGWKPRGISSQCKAMRSFFRFAETRSWCTPDLALAIKGPRIPKSEARPMGPTWTQVRQLLNLAKGNEPEHLRARALLLLLTVYGLRSREVIELRLEDFDWRNEVFTVRRAKNGRIQQYPIQYEVGEAIIKYIRHARPSGDARHLFLGERRPWGPMLHATVWRTVARRLRALGIGLEHQGPHALRHACATRLLQKGFSLKDIADFLGHRDTKSVGIYAKHDIDALRKVAAFRLAGLR